MDHRVDLRLTLTRRHSPLLRRGANEHQPGCSAGEAHDIKKASDGMRTVRVLIAVSRIADRLINFHALPVGIQFIGYHQGQGCANYSAHFRTMSNNPDGSVGLDTHKHIGMKSGIICVSMPIVGLLSPQYFRRVTCAQDERSRSSHALQKPTPTYIFNRAHASSFAAALIAARMR